MDPAEIQAVQARLDASVPYDDEASTITIVVGLSLPQVLEAFGGDAAEPPISLEETWDDETDPETVLLIERPGAVIAVEFNGYEGSRAEVLTRASANGRVASVYWNVNMHTRLSLAEAGTVHFHEEIWDDLGSDDPALAPLFDGLDFDEHWLPSSIAVGERWTGVRIDGPMPPEPLVVHRIHPHLSRRVRREPTAEEARSPYRNHAEIWALGEDVGEMAARQIAAGIEAAAVPVRRRLAAYAVRRALRAAGMENDPDLAATLASLDTDPVLAPEAEMLIRRGTHVGYNTPTPPSACALRALDEAVSGDSGTAALEAVRWAVVGIEGAAQWQDRPAGRRLMDWEWHELPTIRGRYHIRRDLRAFLEEVFARLGVTPEPGALLDIPPPPAEAPGGTWSPVAPWPYEPWWHATTAWTGAEALVFGARLDAPQESNLPFATASAAGAYDPVRDRWRPVAPPPFAPGWGPSTVCGWVFYVLDENMTGGHYDRRLWAYGIPGGSWRQAMLPRGDIGHARMLSTAGDTLVLWGNNAHGGPSPVWLYDPIAGHWREAPPSPWQDCQLVQVLGLPDGRIVRMDVPAAAMDLPAHMRRGMSVGIVLTGPVPEGVDVDSEFAAIVAEWGSVHGGFDASEDEDEDDDGEYEQYDPEDDGDDPEHPSYTWRVAVLDPGAHRWRPLPTAPVATGIFAEPRWLAVGRWIVCAHRGRRTAYLGEQGSETAKLPYGGVLDLDTGRWEELPDLPGRDLGDPMRGENTLRDLAGGTTVALHNGWAYDPLRRVWIELPEFPGRAYGLASTAAVWAGDRLLVFANGAVEPVEDDEFATRVVRVHEGWSWRP